MPTASSNPTQRPKPRATAPTVVKRSARDTAERILAGVVATLGIIALAGFACTLLHVAFRDSVDFFAGIAWQYAYWLPLFALPLMIVGVITLVVMGARAKSRANRS